MIGTRAFIALGSNTADAAARIDAALRALDVDGLALAAVARLVRSPYEGAADAPPVLNTVAEVRTWLTPEDVLERLHAVEAEAGRERDGNTTRSLDLDLLAHGFVAQKSPELTVPHPRFSERAFVLAPWEEISPGFVLTGPYGQATVLEYAATLRRDAPERFAQLEVVGAATLPDRAAICEVLEDRHALRAWRERQSGSVGIVPTMGALHAGHASLIQRAAAECDAVVATLFVNPLQFAPDEDLDRYPRTFEEDLALLAHHGADAVYAPARDDLYPEDFSTYVEPSGPAEGFEGEQRPEHFRGVATVVVKLWNRVRPERGYFGRKDAQQLSVLRRVFADLDLEGRIIPCPTMRADDGLARSSRNRYLSASQRPLARALSEALAGIADDTARGERDAMMLAAKTRVRLESPGVAVDYVALVDGHTMKRVGTLRGPALAIAAARVGDVRLLDNRWVAPPLGGAQQRAGGR